MKTDQPLRVVADASVLVVKLGSSLVTNDGRGLDVGAIANWTGQIARLHALGKRVILVSSGAIAQGLQRLGWTRRPHAIHELQAAAAIGQMGLAQCYESQFREHGLASAQILLTHDDMANRKRYLNARSTLRTLLELDVIPVVNENDTVVTDEIRVGENDTLGALVTNLIEADALIILTDQSGLHEADPRKVPDARLIARVRAGDPALERIAGGAGSMLGRGGMITKVLAAKRAARSGADTVIVSGREPDVLVRLAQGEQLGTVFEAGTMPLAARKQWLADHLSAAGRIVLDDGAIRALAQDRKSLLPIGVQSVNGSFERGELVACVDPQGREIARGLINYSAAETRLIMRRSSRDIESILGYVDEPELIHRDNLVLV